jgi:twitching motility protein PilT
MELFHRILQTAVSGHASDIHIKPNGPIIFRIHQDLIPIEAPMPTVEWVNKVVENIVPKHFHKKLEDDRECDFSYYVQGVGRFRTNVFQQRGDWCLAMRYVKAEIPSFEQLGLLPILKKIAEAPRGIVLIAGATGSGKSTTLAAMIQHLNDTTASHIITLEDPIEFVFEDKKSTIEQREIGLDTSSFNQGLKHILRQDPDVIMIGEMRDATSFSAAMSCADTGHTVISTVHTTNASQSVSRVLEFFKADEREQVRKQLAATLQAVICQRMVPKVGGGVVPALEILINTGTVKKMIEENRLDKLAAAIETSQDDGMQSFNQALFNLVKERKVTEKEALANATNAQALEMNFKGIFLDEGRRILS